ncbi:MAG: hypothetical protein AB7H66_08615 [Hyphomonadaceae bacterium]
MTDPKRARSFAPVRPPQVALKTLKYSESEEHLLRRLAGALVLHWDELSDEMQDLIIDQAACVDDRDPASHEASDLERFVRTVKTASVTKRREALNPS